MIDADENQRIVIPKPSQLVIVALGKAVQTAHSNYADSSRCFTCSEHDREQLRQQYESLRGLYEQLTDPNGADAGKRDCRSGPESQAEAPNPGQCEEEH